MKRQFLHTVGAPALATVLATALGSTLLTGCSAPAPTQEAAGPATLKEAVGDMFLVGCAMNMPQVKGLDARGQELARTHFNSIVAENCMKSEAIHPAENTYFWDDADAFVDFGTQNNMFVVGHCLIWHSQLAQWFAVDKDGKEVAPEVLKQRMKDHITTIMTRYKGRVKGYDVVNETVVEGGSYRDTPFYRILGEEFIPLAFQYAHEADSTAELYINDYGMTDPGRRSSTARIVRDLKARGLRIDAVGMQAHIGMDYPDLADFAASIDTFAACGVKVMITEWDMSALPNVSRSSNIADTAAFKAALNPYPNGLPDSVAAVWNKRAADFWQLLVEKKDVISRFNAWGVTDAESWKNGFPVRGRTDYPLLFDRDGQPKQFVKDIIGGKN